MALSFADLGKSKAEQEEKPVEAGSQEQAGGLTPQPTAPVAAPVEPAPTGFLAAVEATPATNPNDPFAALAAMNAGADAPSPAPQAQPESTAPTVAELFGESPSPPPSPAPSQEVDLTNPTAIAGASIDELLAPSGDPASPLTVLQYDGRRYSESEMAAYLDNMIPALEACISTPQVDDAVQHVGTFLKNHPELHDIIMPEAIGVFVRALCASTNTTVVKKQARKTKATTTSKKREQDIAIAAEMFAGTSWDTKS